MNKTINPELVKKAAEVAIPTLRWQSAYDANGDLVVFAEVVGDKIGGTDIKRFEFDPLTSDSDAWALLLALLKEDWEIKWATVWRCWKADNKHIFFCGEYFRDESMAMLLLKCLSAMTGLPLYLEDKQ